MELLDVVQRQAKPEPWAEGEKIPWDEPAFSQRMLDEHLSQAHNSASRRSEIINRQVAWIHGALLSGKPSRILDLGCGPGLYASRLAALGHACKGIDFGPASIAYAREQAEQGQLACEYVLDDIRTADYGSGYGLVMLLFGEFNVFRKSDVATILRRAHTALVEGGLLLLEPHTYAAVCQLGGQSWWHAAEEGLFSNQPHLLLYESMWDRETRTTTERHFVVDAATGHVTRHASTMQAYTEAEYTSLLVDCGFDEVTFYPSLTGDEKPTQKELIAVVAEKPTSQYHVPAASNKEIAS
jgi:SAM-dependent methyltransferase